MGPIDSTKRFKSMPSRSHSKVAASNLNAEVVCGQTMSILGLTYMMEVVCCGTAKSFQGVSSTSLRIGAGLRACLDFKTTSRDSRHAIVSGHCAL